LDGLLGDGQTPSADNFENAEASFSLLKALNREPFIFLAKLSACTLSLKTLWPEKSFEHLLSHIMAVGKML